MEYSKIKDLYVELSNYKFFHRPSNISNQDERIIGREKEKNKLRDILTRADSESGAYLVTGFRGMGKTSLVNDVLDGLNFAKKVPWKRIVRVYLVLLIVLWFKGPFTFNSSSFSQLLIIILIPALFLIYSIWKTFFNTNKHPFNEFKPPSPGMERSLIFAQDYIVLSSIYAIGLLIDSIIKTTASSFNSLVIYTIIFLVFLSYNLVKNLTLRGVKTLLAHAFNYGGVEQIHINLGKDNLNESDILRQIVLRLCIAYKRIKSPFNSLQRTLWSIVSIGLIFILFGQVYYQSGIYNGVNKWKREYLADILPSQVLFRSKPELDFVRTQKIYAKTVDGNIENYRNQLALFSPDIQTQALKPFQELNFVEKNLNYLDYLLFQTYHGFLEYITAFRAPGISKKNPYEKETRASNYFREPGLTPDFRILLPAHLDYTYLLGVALLLLLYHIMLRRRLGGVIITHEYVYKKLLFLRDRIESQVTRGQSANSSFNGKIGNFSFFSNQSKNKAAAFPVADFSTLESQLLIILELISKIPTLSGRPRFVFVFDELDKIDPFYSATISEKGDENLRDTNQLGTTESPRNRQQVVSKTLANLKHFFNTADAKFIFIAGREMFDASMAGASDRESLIRSIFNEVIYIKSFYTEDSDNTFSDITSMTEAYLCQFLPQFEERTNDKTKLKWRMFKNFYRSLIFKANQAQQRRHQIKENATLHKFYTAIHNSQVEIVRDAKILKQEDTTEETYNRIKVKTLFTIKNFIAYLAYRSNGSPKNITQLLENYIIPYEGDAKWANAICLRQNRELKLWFSKKTKSQNPVLFKRHRQSYYLKLTEKDQYKFGLTSHLFMPFLNNEARFLKEFGDKLLVSSSFLFDHLYKFHMSAFSSRNLELTPDIININKAPQLRKFIYGIIDHLTNTHLSHIISGLYEFKFQSKIRAEINYISKVSELESAAFNFTLDESLQIKKHYKRRLEELIGHLKNSSSAVIGNYSNSVGFLNMLIGELHFYDQEYDEAQIYYKNAIQPLRDLYISKKGLDTYNFTVYVRNLLKLGLTFEKSNNFDSAYMTYSKLTAEIVNRRNVDHKKFGLKEMTLGLQGIQKAVSEQSIEELLEATTTRHDQNPLPQLMAVLDNKTLIGAANEISHELESLLKNAFKSIVPNSEPGSFETLIMRLTPYSNREAIEFVKAFIILTQFGKRSEIIVYHRNEDSRIFSFEDNLIFLLRLKLGMNSDLANLELKKGLFENLRLIYQPSLAKLTMLEKGGPNGITFSDLRTTLKEAFYILKPIRSFEKSIVVSEYYNKIGDILYYKNGLLYGTKFNIPNLSEGINETTKHGQRINQHLLFKVFNVKFEKSQEEQNDNKPARYFNVPLSSLFYYFTSLYITYYSFYHDEEKDQLGLNDVFSHGAKDMIELSRSFITSLFINEYALHKYDKFRGQETNTFSYHEKRILKGLFHSQQRGLSSSTFTTSRLSMLNSLGNSLTDLGDAYFSMVVTPDKGTSNQKLQGNEDVESLINILKYLDFKFESYRRHSKDWLGQNIQQAQETNYESIIKDISEKFNLPFEKSILYYFLSYLFFEKAGRYKRASIQLTKIIYLVMEITVKFPDLLNTPKQDDLARGNRNTKKQVLFDLVEKNIYRKAVQHIHRSYDNTIRPERMAYAKTADINYHWYWNENQIKAFNQSGEKGDKHDQIFMDREYIKHSSISSSLKELYFLMAELSINLDAKIIHRNKERMTDKEELILTKDNINIHPYVTTSSKFTRISELLFKARFNFQEAIRLKYLSLSDDAYDSTENSLRVYEINKVKIREMIQFYQNKPEQEEIEIELEGLIIDSIYCLNSVLEMLYTFGASYLFPHSTFGLAHFWLGDWCKWLKQYINAYYEFPQKEKQEEEQIRQQYKKLLQEHKARESVTTKEAPELFEDKYDDKILMQMTETLRDKIDETKKKKELKLGKVLAEKNEKRIFHQLTLLLDDKNYTHLNSSYQFTNAREHFYEALQTHNEGPAYRSFISNMYYLEDDLNDDYYHFFAARERYRINAGIIHKKLDQVAYHLRFSQTNHLSIFFKDYLQNKKN